MFELQLIDIKNRGDDQPAWRGAMRLAGRLREQARSHSWIGV
ncbi:hypothetical protein EDB98_109180 [Pseudomonas fluorescens]|nr:hypothetical protein EDB98_109180 [Pseudomonas fluorescens]SFW12701.1 hypothetical protein SAMN03159439_00084 [Pseudomonas sp. NFACC04-2]